MKEKYLDEPGFKVTIDEMITTLTGHHHRHKPWHLHPGSAALLVLDIQNYFLDPSSHAFTPSAPAIIPNIQKLIGMARKFKMAVIFTRHVNDHANAGRMDKWWRDLIREDSYEAQISETLGLYNYKAVELYDDKTVGLAGPVRDDSMVGRYDEKIIVKHQYDAFLQN